VACGNLAVPKGNQMAPFVRVAPHLRTILAPHVPLKLVDRCCLGPANHVERNGLMRVNGTRRAMPCAVSRLRALAVEPQEVVPG
jgi:hypothetical protein